MRFWDASALMPLCVDQPESSRIKTLLDSDGVMAVWWGSVVECWSAFARLRREGLFSIDDEDAARELLQMLQDSWIEILPSEDVRTHAGRLLRLHAVRSAHALQLAAALVWAGDPPSGEVVVLDRRLYEAVRLEGLTARP
jgi:predicted nucleic acid-binding protein